MKPYKVCSVALALLISLHTSKCYTLISLNPNDLYIAIKNFDIHPRIRTYFYILKVPQRKEDCDISSDLTDDLESQVPVSVATSPLGAAWCHW